MRLEASRAQNSLRGTTLSNLLDQLGLKDSVLLAGFAGGVIRALSRGRYTIREIVASPVCGALAAGYLTTPILHYLRAVNFPLPPDDGSNVAIHAGAFLVGTSAMWISDAVFDWFTRRTGRKPKDGE